MFFSKILERLVFNRCIDYINHHEIFNDKQFGFRPKHSTYMAIAQLVDKVTNADEKDKTTIGIFLDLSKAFDTIDHKILVNMLRLMIVLRIHKISFVVSHRVPYWVHCFLYCMLMISHIHQISLILFCLLMTPQFCTRIKIYQSKYGKRRITRSK